MNQQILFNDGWEFAKMHLEAKDAGAAGQDPSELNTAAAAGLSYEPVDLPHDWLIYNSLDLYENSIGWYRKKFTYNEGEKQVLLAFDGVYMDSSVYVNGQLVGEWKYGYSAFEHEITQALVPGENEIIVKVVHQSPNSRWYSGAGIYRDVWLKTRANDHIVTNGIYVSTTPQGQDWLVEVETDAHIQQDGELVHTIMDQGKVIAASSDRLTAGTESTVTSRQQITAENPLLWSTDEPHLYQLVTELKMAGETVEKVTQSIGFRTVSMDPNDGFRLNGVKMKLNGVCEHHDLGALGAAFNVTALRRRFELLKEMGVNSIRTAHNMPAKAFMELADEMGMLIVSEAFDMWERSKTPYDYARFFPEWAHTDVKSWVMRDRNHPSLIMWSIGNEIYDTHADERGQEVTQMLMDYVLEFDPKQNGRVTIGSNYMPWENAQKCADIVKVAGYNYAEKYYDKHHAEHPDWIIYGSETASVVQSRGIYHFPFEKAILADDDEQCSALGNSTTSWGAKSAEACILAERDTPYSLGQYLWTGFDYIGEPTPYHTKNSYFGQLDTATFKKDSYYIYQSAWTDYKKAPMVHIFPYWDFSPGQMIDVRVCSNAPKIELQLNGSTIGTYDIDHENGKQLVGWWKVPYEPGELKAIAYDENGHVIATDVQKSYADAAKIRLLPDKRVLIADGTDLIFVEINVEDEAGNVVQNANNRANVSVSGAGRLIGLDSGDSTDYDQYKGQSKRLFSGKLMAIIGATKEPGAIKIEVTSEGLIGQSAEFQSVPAADEAQLGSIDANTKNEAMAIVMGSAAEVPLRKIELISSKGQVLNPSNTMLTVTANLYPANTSYTDLEWSVVNDAGIESNIAKIEADGHTATISALGDGEFLVRATSKNGTDKTKLISHLEFRAEGLGTAFKDPYGFITGGLYDDAIGDVSNGNEKGFATSRDGKTVVGFQNIDFGAYGSDTMTIPIFALSNEEYFIQIWEGLPEEEGSTLLADVVYQKESKWNVYQEETYRLSKRLNGITSIYFVLNQKIHVKGFTFEKKNRAFEQNAAAQCDHIYGDTFTVSGDQVEGIGNNVSLEFSDMDFTVEGTSRIVFYGSSPIDKNTIHIRFAGPDGESNQLVEFVQSNGYEEQVFELETVTGKQKVTFIFLPGSNFDFGWFKFEK